jgi:hypothetical protein
LFWRRKKQAPWDAWFEEERSPYSCRRPVELQRYAKAKQESGADTAPLEEFWKDRALLFGALVWLCHGSGDLQQVASHRVFVQKNAPAVPLCEAAQSAREKHRGA